MMEPLLSHPQSELPVEYGGIQTASRTLGQLAAALAKAQGEMEGATKASVNPFFRSKYADLAAVWSACRAPLTKHGLAVLQTFVPPTNGQPMILVTTLIHESGEWIESRWPIVPVKDDPQGLGSASTYGRRFSLQAIAGVAAEDDDGEAASGRGKNTKAEPETPVLSPATLDSIMSVAKEQYAGKGYKSSRVIAHLDKLAQGLGASDLSHLPVDKVADVVDAIRNGSEPAA